MAQRAFDNVLQLFRLPQPKPAPKPPSPPAPSTTPEPTVVAPPRPVDLNGFYAATGPNEVTFYATANTTPRDQIGPGWTLTGATGLDGTLVITSVDPNFGVDPRTQLQAQKIKKISDKFSESYIWSFTLQTDKEQSVPPYQYATGVILYPPGQMAYAALKRSGVIYGKYDVIQNVTTFVFSEPPPDGFGPGWSIVDMPGFSAPLKVVSYTELPSQKFAIMEPTDGSVPVNTERSVIVNGAPTTAREPDYSATFVPAKFAAASDQAAQTGAVDMIDETPGTAPPPLRDLNTGLKYEPFVTGPYDDLKGLGASTGSLLSLYAVGPQEKYTLTEDFSQSQWDPSFKRHTNSVMYQRIVPLPPANPYYQNQTIQIELLPTELGHLLSNMYLKVTMPALGTGYQYAPQLGRALIKQVDLLVNETVIETLYDDWYIVRDQLFLDADEQTGMFQAVGGSNINSQVATDYIIPLEFFFCRRKSHALSDSERLRRPYFPLCAMWNQKLYVRFTFHPNTWWCNVAAPHTTDLVLPKLVMEEILLDNSEKLHYMNTPLRYIVNRVKKESTLTFSAGNPQLQLTASFPVQTLAWFFRNKNYEDVTSGLYSDSRYNYGYTTQYIQTGINLQFPSGNSNYIDVINNAKITLNNVDILSTFQGSLYYTFKQPMEHGLSIPSKNIYTYSFGLTPKEYNQGGYLNFSKLNSQTTTLTLSFNPIYASQITQGYNLYLFYYGYTLLEFQGGFARLPFV